MSFDEISLRERVVNKILWVALLHKVFFRNVVMFFSIVLIEEFVLRRPEASPFTKPLFAHVGRHVGKNVYWNVSVSLKCVLI